MDKIKQVFIELFSNNNEKSEYDKLKLNEDDLIINNDIKIQYSNITKIKENYQSDEFYVILNINLNNENYKKIIINIFFENDFNLLNNYFIKNKLYIKKEDDFSKFVEDDKELSSILPQIKSFMHSNNMTYDVDDDNRIDLKSDIFLKEISLYKANWPKMKTEKVFYLEKSEFIPLRNLNYFNVLNYDEKYLEKNLDLNNILAYENYFCKEKITIKDYKELEDLLKNKINLLVDNFFNIKNLKIIYEKYEYSNKNFLKNNLSNFFKEITDIFPKVFEINFDFNLFFNLNLIIQNIFLLSFKKLINIYEEIKEYIDNQSFFIIQLIYNELFELKHAYYIFLNLCIKDILEENINIKEKFNKNFKRKFLISELEEDRDLNKVSIFTYNTIEVNKILIDIKNNIV